MTNCRIRIISEDGMVELASKTIGALTDRAYATNWSSLSQRPSSKIEATHDHNHSGDVIITINGEKLQHSIHEGESPTFSLQDGTTLFVTHQGIPKPPTF